MLDVLVRDDDGHPVVMMTSNDLEVIKKEQERLGRGYFIHEYPDDD